MDELPHEIDMIVITYGPWMTVQKGLHEVQSWHSWLLSLTLREFKIVLIEYYILIHDWWSWTINQAAVSGDIISIISYISSISNMLSVVLVIFPWNHACWVNVYHIQMRSSSLLCFDIFDVFESWSRINPLKNTFFLSVVCETIEEHD